MQEVIAIFSTMNIYHNPSWIAVHKYKYSTFSEIPDEVFDDINRKLALKTKGHPVVSIIIAAWNEEVNILNCVSSLVDMDSTTPFEIIVVDNNSQDDTAKTLKRLELRTYFESNQGCGPARQLGQTFARGQYILLADADCIYPREWLNKMVDKLKVPNTACVYGRYSFIGEAGYPRWKLFILERLKDFVANLRHYRRPYLNAYGISMGYIRDYGLKVGFIDHNTRGDDGRLCFDLMQFGKIRQVRSEMARPWTSPRTLQKDGTFSRALLNRISTEIKRLPSLLSFHPPHDTKTSRN